MSTSLWPHGLYSSWNSPGQNTGVGSLSLLQGIFPTQGSHPGLPHYGQILYHLSYQGSPRILDWVAYPFSRGSSWPRNWTKSEVKSLSCVQIFGFLCCRQILYQLSYQGSPMGECLFTYLKALTWLIINYTVELIFFLKPIYLFHLAVLGLNCCM